MGDLRYQEPYRRVSEGENAVEVMHQMTDEEIIAALAGTAREQDSYLANILASEAQNRAQQKATAMAYLGEGVITVDRDGRILSLNPSAERMLGWTRAEIGDTPLHDLIHPGTGDTHPCALLETLQRGEVVRSDHEHFLTKEGTLLPVSTVASPIVREGDVLGAVLLAGDVTERRRSEAALKESEERHRLTLEGIKDHAVFLLDPEGVIVSWNKGAERLKQWRAEEVIGKHYSLLFPADLVAEGLPWKETEEAARTGRYEDETVRIRKDGSLFQASVVLNAIRDEDGSLWGFVKVTRDITQRKKTAEALRASEERFRRLVEGIHDTAVFMLDKDGAITSWNEGAERVKGYTAQEVVGRHFSMLCPTDAVVRKQPHEELRLAAETGRYEVEEWRVRKSGERFWAKVSITPVRDENGEVKAYTKVVRDLTDQKRLERESKQEADRHRALFEASPLALARCDPSGLVLEANASFETLLGYAGADLVGHPLQRIVAADTLPGLLADLKALAPGKPRERVVGVTGRDGRRIELPVRVIPIVSDGEVAGAWITADPAAR